MPRARAKAKDPIDTVLDVAEDIQAEVDEVGERLDQLEKSENPQVVEAVKLSRQFTHSVLWLAKLQANIMPMSMSNKFLRLFAENGAEVLTAIQEAQIDLATMETRALLTSLGFYKA